MFQACVKTGASPVGEVPGCGCNQRLVGAAVGRRVYGFVGLVGTTTIALAFGGGGYLRRAVGRTAATLAAFGTGGRVRLGGG